MRTACSWKESLFFSHATAFSLCALTPSQLGQVSAVSILTLWFLHHHHHHHQGDCSLQHQIHFHYHHLHCQRCLHKVEFLLSQRTCQAGRSVKHITWLVSEWGVILNNTTHLAIIIDVTNIIRPVRISNKEHLLFTRLQSFHYVNGATTVDEYDVVWLNRDVTVNCKGKARWTVLPVHNCLYRLKRAHSGCEPGWWSS